MKKAAIMQPYFLPYIGYWQLLQAVDEFVVYDNIEYTKKGWFNRNRILESDHDRLFTIPLKKASDYLPVNKRYLSDDSDKEIARTLRIIESNYKKAPQFSAVYPVIKNCFQFSNKNLFEYIYNSIKLICDCLEIETKLTISSQVPVDHDLKAEKKVLAICKALQAATYVNAIGGLELYNKGVFEASGVELKFIKANTVEYLQLNNTFVPGLSIIDVMMFNDKGKIKQLLSEYTLI